MNVQIIDTSVMLNLLEVPNCCSDAKSVKEHLRVALEEKDMLIMPIATIIETGNHIAHISDGNVRWNIAGKFGEYLRKTARKEAPWEYYGVDIGPDGLMYLADHIKENAKSEMGIGDMSIVYVYERCKESIPSINKIMIWSTDRHLQAYQEENVSMKRRRKKV